MRKILVATIALSALTLVGVPITSAYTIRFTSPPITGVPVTHSGGGCPTNCTFTTPISYPDQNFLVSVPLTQTRGGNTYRFVQWVFENGFTRGSNTTEIYLCNIPDVNCKEDVSDRTAAAIYELVPPPPPKPPVPLGCVAGTLQIIDLAGKVQNFYNTSLGIGAILAFGIIVFAGVLYATGGAMPDNISNAKKWIWAALLGILLLFGSFVLLAFIGPNLTDVINFGLICNPRTDDSTVPIPESPGLSEGVACTPESFGGIPCGNQFECIAGTCQIPPTIPGGGACTLVGFGGTACEEPFECISSTCQIPTTVPGGGACTLVAFGGTACEAPFECISSTCQIPTTVPGGGACTLVAFGGTPCEAPFECISGTCQIPTTVPGGGACTLVAFGGTACEAPFECISSTCQIPEQLICIESGGRCSFDRNCCNFDCISTRFCNPNRADP